MSDAILTVAALAAESDDTAAAVLLDLLLENPKQTEWRDERVMMLCLGVPMDPRPPAELGEMARANWRRKRDESIDFAKRQWDLYAGRADFARAMIAVVIFGEWAERTSYNASPWPVARRADPKYQARLAKNRDRRAARRHFRAAAQVRENALAEVRRGA